MIHIWNTFKCSYINMRRSCILVVLCLVGKLCAESGTDVQDVLTKLFTTDKYNKKIRPLVDQSGAVQISVDFFLTSIIDFNDQDESLKTSGFLSMEWTDEYLQWNPADYNGVDVIFLPQEDIWRPGVSLRNPYKSFTGLGSAFLNLRVDSSGGVEWYPFQVFESTCDVDITYFPFDTQSCELKFIAWSYSKEEVELNKGSRGVILAEYSANAVWDIESTSAIETNTGEASVTFIIRLKRKAIFYVINIIIPVILLSVLNVFTFVLPVTTGERASYSITVFLSLAVFLTIVAQELPTNSDVISLLSVYLTAMEILSTLIVLICILQLRLATRIVEEFPINKFYKTIYKVSMFLQCRKQKNKVKSLKLPDKKAKDKLKKEDEFDSERKKCKLTWMKVVSAMDYLLFWIFLLLTFIITLVLFLLCANN